MASYGSIVQLHSTSGIPTTRRSLREIMADL
jgi:hypothetical protein